MTLPRQNAECCHVHSRKPEKLAILSLKYYAAFSKITVFLMIHSPDMFVMGARLCCLQHPISDQICQSPRARDDKSGSSSNKILKRKVETETAEKSPKLTLEEWILASPGLKPEYLIRDEASACKQSKKKVHPCVGQSHGSLLAEAKDSLYLERPMNYAEEMSSCSSITASLSGKSHKRVNFNLPPLVVVYSPEPEEQEPYHSTENEDSFSSSIFGDNSFDSAQEPVFRLAVDILPHVFVSSKI
ncbi:hypothetical protein RJT34_29670 [Clitoria ternatea]|uniref:Uncharacterized protein n=1 Tax=Clitoria ternatea TaxID=43366 RepID=A0AAN9EVP2_CLITE